MGFPIITDQPADQQLAALTNIVKDNNGKKDNEDCLYTGPAQNLFVIDFDERTGEYVTKSLDSPDSLGAVLRQWVEPISPVGPNGGGGLPQPYISSQLVKAYEGRKKWPGVPFVRRFAPAPILRPDWSIAWTTGYDPESEVYISRSAQYLAPEITEEHLEQAKGHLNWLFREFALVHTTSYVDCLALMLTPFILDVIPDDPIPAGMLKGDKAGSGKTKLADLIGMMGAGSKISMRSLPRGGELRKALTAILIGNKSPVILFDNVKSRLDDDALEGLITSRTGGDRQLGKSVDVELRNDALWLFSLNSPDLSEDMLRRSVFIYLNPELAKTDAPWTGGPNAHVKQNLDWYRACLVTLIQWWVQKGRPEGSTIMVGFEEWSKIMSGILECAGYTGLLDANESNKDDVYTEAEGQGEVLERIYELVRKECARPETEIGSRGGQFTSASLENLLSAPAEYILDGEVAALRRWGFSNTRTIGRELATLTGRPLGGYKLVKLDIKTGNKKWYEIQKIQTAADIAENKKRQEIGSPLFDQV